MATLVLQSIIIRNEVLLAQPSSHISACVSNAQVLLCFLQSNQCHLTKQLCGIQPFWVIFVDPVQKLDTCDSRVKITRSIHAVLTHNVLSIYDVIMCSSNTLVFVVSKLFALFA